ncbi:MAG: hypothetical protein Q9M36_13270 [Sulfurovum sp.]|nr:hypothetical protein [Sulfurovum sp.]
MSIGLSVLIVGLVLIFFVLVWQVLVNKKKLKKTTDELTFFQERKRVL